MNILKIGFLASAVLVAGCTSKSTCSDGVDDEITQIINSTFYDPTLRTAVFKVAQVSSVERTELGGFKCSAFLSMNGFQPKSLESSIKLEYEVTDTSVMIPATAMDEIPAMVANAVGEFKLNPYANLDLTKTERLSIAQHWDQNYIIARKSFNNQFDELDDICSHAAESSVNGSWGSAMNGCNLPAIF